jgi:hypothetical protein
MAQIDPTKESERLAALYGGMNDSELAEIAADASSLTDIALQALRAEMARRGMEPLPDITASEIKDVIDHSKPVMIRRYRDLPEASVAKSILDSAGIESFMADDNLVRMDWFYSNLVGGIKILVREQDAEAAIGLLDQAIPEKFETDVPGEYEQPRCPNCQSFEVSFDGLDKRIAYTGLFIGLPLSITNKGWRCHACGHTWPDAGGAAPSEPKLEQH